MTATRRPTPAVYRRRRLFVLLIALALIGGIVWAVIAQPWRLIADMFAAPEGDETVSTPLPTGDPTSAPTDSPTPEPTPTETEDTGPKPCDPKVIEVSPVTDKEWYAWDENPQLSIRLKNTGSVDCTFNVGTNQQRFEITSGSDLWWNSTHCQSDPAEMIVTLAAGQEVTSSEPLVWDRTRSREDTCDSADRPRAPGGGASYHLSVSIGGVDSPWTAYFILG